MESIKHLHILISALRNGVRTVIVTSFCVSLMERVVRSFTFTFHCNTGTYSCVEGCNILRTRTLSRLRWFTVSMHGLTIVMHV